MSCYVSFPPLYQPFFHLTAKYPCHSPHSNIQICTMQTFKWLLVFTKYIHSGFFFFWVKVWCLFGILPLIYIFLSYTDWFNPDTFFLTTIYRISYLYSSNGSSYRTQKTTSPLLVILTSILIIMNYIYYLNKIWCCVYDSFKTLSIQQSS